jgi:tetratricopeptide (TPR) repeat protein
MDDVEAGLERVRRLIHDGELTDAETAADALLASHPEHGGLWCAKGECRRRLGDHAGCVQALEAASVRMELPAESQLRLAECYAGVGRNDVAVWLLRDVPNKHDCTSCLALRTAAALGRLGECDAALELCLEVRERFPDRGEAAFGVAYYMNRMGKAAEEVAPFLQAAHELDPDNTMYRVSLSLCLACLGRTHEAYGLVKDVDLRSVEWPHCLTRLMEIFASAGDQSRYLDCQARMRQLGDALTR